MANILRLVFGFILFFSSQSGIAKQKTFYEFALSFDENFNLNLDRFFEPQTISISKIKSDQSIWKNYEGFISYLESTAPDLFENYVLIYQSGGLQPASKSNPRVVMFGQGLFIAFSEPQNTNKRRVEIIEFDKHSFEFIFHEITFESGATSRIESNPKLCNSCHGKPSKPIWAPYDFWPNAYGSALSRTRKNTEKQALDEFYLSASRDNRGVYSKLKKNFIVEGNRYYLESVEAFTYYTYTLNFLRVAKELQKTAPQIQRFMPAMFSVLNLCTTSNNSKFENLFPSHLRTAIADRVLQLEAKMLAERNSYKSYLETIYKANFPDGDIIFNISHQRLENESQIAAHLQIVLESFYPIQQITADLGINEFFLSSPSNFAVDFLTAMLAFDRDFILKLNPRALPMDSLKWLTFHCAELQENSVKYLQPINELPPKISVKKSLIGECADCHVKNASDRNIPYIPFDRTDELANELTKNNARLYTELLRRINSDGNDRMPPNRNLTNDEKQNFRELLDRLIQ